MTGFIDQMPDVVWQLTIVLTLLLVKSVVTAFETQPTTNFFHFYCQRLSDKVNNSQNGKRQQIIAGAIATMITLVPIVTILWLFESFIEVPIIWHALLLYVSLSGFGKQKVAGFVISALQQQDKTTAKKTLQPSLLRETANMSPLGLNKATIEMLWLNHLQRQFVVICCYLTAGPLFAIIYRLLLEMHYSWNTKITAFQHFGRFSTQAVTLIQWLPSVLLTLSFSLVTLGNNQKMKSPLLRRLLTSPSNMLLRTVAEKSDLQLGGVAIYHGIKLRRESFNLDGKQPDIKDLSTTLQQIKLVHTLNIGILISILTVAIITTLKP